MKTLRIASIYTISILTFFAIITIIEFIHYPDPGWHTIATFFLFPLITLLIILFVATLIVSYIVTYLEKKLVYATHENSDTPKGIDTKETDSPEDIKVNKEAKREESNTTDKKEKTEDE